MSTAIILLSLLGHCLASHELRVHNRCNEEIWVGLLGNPTPDNGQYWQIHLKLYLVLNAMTDMQVITTDQRSSS